MSLSIDDIQAIYESPCSCGCSLSFQECLSKRTREAFEAKVNRGLYDSFRQCLADELFKDVEDTEKKLPPNYPRTVGVNYRRGKRI